MSVLQPIESPADVVVQATNVTKVYGKGEAAVRALRGVDVQIGRGEFTAIMGPSGSGKSTLMHCLAGLDSITEGTITLDGITVSQLSERKLTRLRRDKIGFIFQSFNLIPTLNAEENIKLPADIAKRPISKGRFNTLVEAVGIADRLKHHPAELSGGQQQRVACARALATDPTVVFADEPTGNLDSKSTRQVLSFLRHAVDSLGQTVVMVTHEPDAAAYADRVLFLFDGQVVAQLRNPQRDTILDALRELGGPDTADSLDEDGAVVSHTGAGSDAHPPQGLRERAPQAPPRWRPTLAQTASGSEATDRVNTASWANVAPSVDATTAVEPLNVPQDTEPPSYQESSDQQSSDQESTDQDANPRRRNLQQANPQESSDQQAAGSTTSGTTLLASSDTTADAPLPGEPLDVALRRMAPARELEPETERVLEAAQRVLKNLPGSVIPQDDPSLTGQIPIVREAPRRKR